MASTALQRLLGMSAPNRKVEALEAKAERQKSRSAAVAGSLARTGSVAATCAAASAAAGYYPDKIAPMGLDLRLVGAGLAGIMGASREMKGKGGMGTKLLEGACDGAIASFIGQKAFAYGQRKAAEASAKGANDGSGAPLQGVPVRQIVETPEPAFAGASSGLRVAQPLHI